LEFFHLASIGLGFRPQYYAFQLKWFLKTAYISKRIFHIKRVVRRMKSMLIHCFAWFLKAAALGKMSKMESEFILT